MNSETLLNTGIHKIPLKEHLTNGTKWTDLAICAFYKEISTHNFLILPLTQKRVLTKIK